MSITGDAYADLGQYNLALADYNEALRLNPEDSIAYNNRGNAYSSLGQLDLAFADFNEALRIDAQNANTYYNRGNAYAGQGKSDLALADYQQALLQTTDPILRTQIEEALEHFPPEGSP